MNLSKLNKTAKIVLGIFSIWPIIYLPLFFGFVLSTFLGMPESNEFPPQLIIIFVLHFFTILVSMILLGLYVFDVFKNQRLAGDKRTLWAVVLLLGGMIAIPIYWYVYIWKSPLEKNSPHK